MPSAVSLAAALAGRFGALENRSPPPWALELNTPSALVRNISTTLASCTSDASNSSRSLESSFVCRLQCQLHEPVLEAALQPWAIVKSGSKLWQEVWRNVCKDGGASFYVIVRQGNVRAWCCGGDRRLCSGNRVWAGGGSQSKGEEQLMDSSMLLNVFREIAAEVLLPDLAFVFTIGSRPLADRVYWAPTPVGHWTLGPGHWSLPLPSPSHLRAHSLGRLGDSPPFERLHHLPWEQRSKRLFWRGRLHDSASTRLKVQEAVALTPRRLLKDIVSRYPDLFDVAFVDEDQSSIVDLDAELPRHRLALDLGTSSRPAGRLVQVLASGAAPLLHGTAARELALEWLEPWEHYVPLRQDLADLVTKVRWLQSAEGADEAQSLAERAHRRFTERFRRQDTYCYVWRALTAIAEVTRSPKNQEELQPQNFDLEWKPPPGMALPLREMLWQL